MGTNKALLKIVKKVGSQAELARCLGLTRGQICNLVHNREKISLKHLKLLIKLSEGEITKKDLRPDIFED